MMTHNSKKRMLVIVSNNKIITFLSFMSILFIFLFSIMDNNDILITVQSSIENTTQTTANNSSNQSDLNSNSSTAIQWKKFVNETNGISFEYPSNWKQDQILENRFEPKDEAFPKKEFPMEESPSGTYFRFSVREDIPVEDNLEILTRMEAAMLLDFSSEESKYEIIGKPNTKEYTIDGEKAGSFSYRVTTDFSLEGSCFFQDPLFAQFDVEKINVIHEGKFYEFQFSFDHCFFVFTTNEFNLIYINKIKDHIFNSIRWLNSTQMDD